MVYGKTNEEWNKEMRRWHKKFAWLPVPLSEGKFADTTGERVWLEYYEWRLAYISHVVGHEAIWERRRYIPNRKEKE